jgi:hypothetical protein
LNILTIALENDPGRFLGVGIVKVQRPFCRSGGRDHGLRQDDRDAHKGGYQEPRDMVQFQIPVPRNATLLPANAGTGLNLAEKRIEIINANKRAIPLGLAPHAEVI